jgi:glutamate-1-semialdehyde 2,1-aminomutase
MRFLRFRDRAAPKEPEPAPEPPDAPDPSEVDDSELAAVDEDEDTYWRRRAAAFIPGGASTGSKRPDALYGPGATFGPTHFERASGCELTTPDGQTLIDCTMALGSVAIGYGDPYVTRAAMEAAAAGNVAGLSHVSEVDVGARLCEVIPCAEQVRFLKTGAEGVAAAVRIARTATGRSRVVGSGYFGWLDWWSDAAGVPSGAHADFAPVPFDDVGALERAVAEAGDQLAAIVVEPVVERLPAPEWVAAARSLASAAGAVLVFDEVKTGFRLRRGGYQEYADVTPDLAVFGKAMANGFPLAAVVGAASVMDAARRTWISSTLAGESTALSAAGAVLDLHEKSDVCGALWRIGQEMRGGVAAAVERSGIEGVSVDGLDPMWLLRFDDEARQSRFIERALAHGVLFKRGAYNFAALAHDHRALLAIEQAASSALVEMVEEGE